MNLRAASREVSASLMKFMDQVKPQKSQFWIWTTLWLTTILDSALIFLVLIVILVVVTPQFVKVPIILFVLAHATRILSLWLGAYVAVKYVLKKTIVFKKEAQKLAFLAIVIPLLGSIAGTAFSAFDFQNLAANLFSAVFVLGITYYSVRNLIIRYGSE